MTTDKTRAASTSAQQRKYVNCRRRLRRLFKGQVQHSICSKHSTAAATAPSSSTTPASTSRSCLTNWFWLSLVSLVFLVLTLILASSQSFALFRQTYTNQYQAIVYNKLNYCDGSQSLRDMFLTIKTRVLHQEAALLELEHALHNQSFQSLALVGTSGVGKSLTARLMQEHFPWTENVQTLSWQSEHPLEMEQALREMRLNLALCGRNLWLIDNMQHSRDGEYVNLINGLASTYHANASHQLPQLSIIYIFNVHGWKDLEQEQLVPGLPTQTQLIAYRSLDYQDLEQCIRLELQLENLQMNQSYVKEMLRTTDVKLSGCKTVHAKILMYGEPQEEPPTATVDLV